MKRIAGLLLVLALLLPQSVFAHMGMQDTVMGVQGYQLNTPKKNILVFDGEEREYILLDWNQNETSTFFVMTKEIFPKRAFDEDSTQKFDIEDPNNIGYWLNHDFWQSGTLSEEVLSSIDQTHVWETEAGNPNGNCPEGYLTTCGISLMSQTEWKRYYPQIGLRDDLAAHLTGWWTRTGRGVTGSKSSMLIVKSQDAELGRTNTWESNNPMYVRPVFYLNRDIFLKKKIDLEKTGARVKRALYTTYTSEELQAAGYSETERRQLEQYYLSEDENIVIQLDKEWLGNIIPPDKFAFRIRFRLSSPAAKNYTICCDADGKQYEKSVTVSPGQEQELVIPIENPPLGVYDFVVRVKEGERIAEQESIPVSIVRDYVRKPLDELSGWGMSTHFGLENRSDERDIELMSRLGVRLNRDELSWHKTEKEKGSFDFSRHDWWTEGLRDRGIKTVAVLNSNNSLYSGNPTVQIGIKNTEQLNGYLRYAQELGKHYPYIKDFEVWNEPNGNNFWRPTANSYDYTNTLKATYEVLKKERPDSNIMGFSIASTDYFFIDQCLQNGAYPYFDSASIHPYMSCNPAEGLQFVHGERNIKDAIWQYGGWKEIDITEMGFATELSVSGSSEPWAALQQVKHLMIAQSKNILKYAIYDFRNDGTNPANREDNYGIIKADFKGKKAYGALSQLYTEIGGNPYIGKYTAENGALAFVYNNGGKPVLAMWHPAGKSEVAFPQPVIVKDLYGNIIAEKKRVSLNNDVVYIDGAEQEWFAKAALGSVQDAISEYREKYQDQETLFAKTAELLQTIPGAEQLGALIDEYQQVGLQIIRENTPLEGSKKTDKLFEVVRPLLNLYGTMQTADRWQGIEDEVKAFESATTIYAKNIHRRAKTAADAVEIASSYPLDYTARFALGKKAESNLLLNWAKVMAEKEGVVETKVLLQMYYGQFSGFNGEKKEFKTVVYNLSDKLFRGKIAVLDENENVIAETEPLEAESGKSIDVSVLAEISGSDGNCRRTFALIREDGVTVQRLIAEIKLEPRLKARLLPVKQAISEWKELEFELENLFDGDVKVTLNVKTDENLNMASDSVQVTLTDKEKKVVSLPVSSVTPTAFNYYLIQFEILDGKNDVLMTDKQPLSFAVIQKTEHDYDLAAFDGNLEQWQNAYPFYINSPENPENKYEWTNSDTAARGFLRWTDNAVYLLADVYDDTQLNVNNDTNIWNGDCLQISIDADNSKSQLYDAGDYEYGFASGTQGLEAYSWQNPNGAGNMGKDMFAFVRDENNKITRYLVKLQPEQLSPLEVTEGSVVGMNIGVNDADVIAREKWIELTEGTVGYKGPYQYHDFRFLPPESGLTTFTELDEHFTSAISGSVGDGFLDIAGHWAEQDIEKANEMGFLRGAASGNSFRPDEPVTRAEFSAMLVNAMEIAPKNDSKYLEDVPSGKWYTTIIYSALFHGSIAAEMLDGYRVMPDKALTREELAAMAGSTWTNKGYAYDVAELKYTDLEEFSPWTVPKIQVAVDSGFFRNTAEQFYPKDYATRAEAVTVILRMRERRDAQ